MFERYEFKLLMSGQTARWEDIPVHQSILVHGRTFKEIDAWAWVYAKSLLTPGVFKVRFNLEGSDQGHYVENWEEMARE